MGYSIDAAIRAAVGQVGYRERGTNDTKFNHWLGRLAGYPHGGYGYAWCVSFQGWTADQGGGRANVDYPRTAGCETAVAWFKSHDRWSSKPHTGDWVFYGPRGGTHVELVVAVNSRTITTIGGNTSGSLSGRYYAGDGVYKKTVTRASSRIYGYGRPAYNSKEDDLPLTDKDVEKVAEAVWDMALAGPPGSSRDLMQAKNVLRETYGRAIEAKTVALQLLAQGADVDEDAIAAAVLAGLTPDRIAAAIPQDIGEQVAEALAARLAAGTE